MLSSQPKKETNRTPAVLDKNLAHFPGNIGTPTANMMLYKILLNSVVSTLGAKFMTIDISNFYLNTRMTDIPDKVVQEYQLHESGKATADSFVYVEVRKGMYGLPQAGILSQQLLERRLNDKGYFQSTLVPGL